jgi:hypothetical protein
MGPLIAAVPVALAVLVLTGCARDGDRTGPERTTPPVAGACRVLTPSDIQQPSNASAVVDCADAHTAETFAVGDFPDRLTAGAEPDDRLLGAFVHPLCQQRFERFIGADDSLVLRATVTWAWFRASTAAWKSGAHWWRCDVVGGGEESPAFVRLPRTAEGLLLGKPDDRWLVCVNGPSVSGSVKIPCSQPHTWRAVTTIVVGKADDAYPGDHAVEVRTRDFCSRSVGAWLSYPVDYDYGYTWFHEPEWKAGNRRSICWAQTRR